MATLTQADANKDEPMKSKADSHEPAKDKASVSQEPMKSKAKVQDTKAVVETPNEALLPSVKTAEIQLENDGEAEKAKLLASVQDKANDGASKAKNEDVLPSENSAEAQLEKEVKADIAGAVQESSKDVEEPTANERVDTNVPEALPLECVGETEKEANKFAIETENNGDAIKEFDVINKVQSDVSNNLQLDVKPVIATKPSQISVTFEMGGETNSDETGHLAEGEDSTTDAVNLPEQSVTTETATSSTYLVNDTLVTCGTDVIVNDIHISLDPCGVDTKNESEIFTSQDGSAASEPVVDPQVAKEAEGAESQNVTSENQNGQDLKSESLVSKEWQSESEISNELHGDSNGQQRQACSFIEDDDDEMSWVDMSFSQPLVPQLSEVVRVGVIARVPEDETTSVVTEANSNDVASAEDGERSDIVGDVEK